MEQIQRKYLSRDQMMKRVARFKDLVGFDGGLPDKTGWAASSMRPTDQRRHTRSTPTA